MTVNLPLIKLTTINDALTTRQLFRKRSAAGRKADEGIGVNNKAMG
ncbi:TPA: hypothetical protein G8V61_004013 [Salmonella enterica]|nr:hypothetical protein [Salmonella enterica]